MNKQYEIFIEPGVQDLYDRMIKEFPKVAEMIEDQNILMHTAQKRYYDNYKEKHKGVDK